MEACEIVITVFFDDPFWVGIYNRISDRKMEVCKITFGAEPKDYEVYAFLMENWHRLRFSPSVNASNRPIGNLNPKRMQRAVRKELSQKGLGTKAQQALKLQQEEGKEARKKKSRLEREQEKERLFEIKQEKKKQKHRGH